MSQIREKLTNMFTKIMAGTVTREEGTMLINALVKEDQATAVKELTAMIGTPPPGVYPKTVLHTIALARNKAFQDLMASVIEHENRELSELAAHELAMLHTDASRDALAGHLSSPVPHARSASAKALAEGFGPEGMEILKEHIKTDPEPYNREASAEALAASGARGLEALVDLLGSSEPGAVACAAGALAAASEELTDTEVPVVIDALMAAGDREDAEAIAALLRLVASLNGKARGFEGFIKAFEDYPADEVRAASISALQRMKEY